MKKRRNQLILILLRKKADPYNDENANDSKWSDLTKEYEEDIALANFIQSLKKKTDEEIFQKKSKKMITISYIMKIKIKKIFFEVISNSKIVNINFFQRNCQRPRFCQTYGGWTTSNAVLIYLFAIK